MKGMPIWFNIWWIINIVFVVVFLGYWYSIDFESNQSVFFFVIYSNLWGLWAAKFRREKSK